MKLCETVEFLANVVYEYDIYFLLKLIFKKL